MKPLPFRSHSYPDIRIVDESIKSPVPGLNPTLARYAVLHSKDTHKDERPKIYWHWTSRNSRKGRHHLVVHKKKTGTQETTTQETVFLPKSTTTPSEIAQGIIRMFTQYPYWDISWLVAVLFTLGSVIWVINGFFAWLPLVDPSTEFPTEALYGGGITAFVGATVFEVGSILLILEAINEDRTDHFGWAILHDGPTLNLQRKHPSELNRPKLRSKEWQWLPTWHDFTHHYIKEIGFLASAAQFLGATVFWISGFTALPGILNHMSQGLTDGVYWAPQVVGGTGFIISGVLFTLETQKRWYIPAFRVLGWHIGFWNLIGAVGFTLCGALGMAYGSSGALYEASLATFWGSWAFLIGSVIQWYESLDKHPVTTTTNSRSSSEESLV